MIFEKIQYYPALFVLYHVANSFDGVFHLDHLADIVEMDDQVIGLI